MVHANLAKALDALDFASILLQGFFLIVWPAIRISGSGCPDSHAVGALHSQAVIPFENKGGGWGSASERLHEYDFYGSIIGMHKLRLKMLEGP